MKNRTLVLGASLNESRYSNMAIRKLRANNVAVVAFGLKEGIVSDVVIDSEKKQYKNIDSITLYLNPKRQEEYYNYIISLQPRRVIFNPGTENMEFMKLLKEHEIKAEVACTLVLLSTKQY